MAAALTAAALIGLVILFQISLALGAPWGAAAWGGTHPGRLPTRMRVASLGSTLVLAFWAWIVLARADLVSTVPTADPAVGPLCWVATGFFALGAVMNAISRSRVERGWAPVALATAICAGIVAAG